MAFAKCMEFPGQGHCAEVVRGAVGAESNWSARSTAAPLWEPAVRLGRHRTDGAWRRWACCRQRLLPSTRGFQAGDRAGPHGR